MAVVVVYKTGERGRNYSFWNVLLFFCNLWKDTEGSWFSLRCSTTCAPDSICSPMFLLLNVLWLQQTLSFPASRSLRHRLHVSFWFYFLFYCCRISSCFKQRQTATPFDVSPRFFRRLVGDMMQRLCGWETGSFDPRDYFRSRKAFLANVKLSGSGTRCCF